MQNLRWLWLCLFNVLGFSVLAQEYPQDYFRSPLEIPLYLSGTFGEIRGNHFHSGMDIKTKHREGQRVVAAAEGDIVRIKISPYGFGNALYLRHPNGYTTVYAHLQRFNDEIEEYVRQAQYEQEKFAVELFPPAGKFSYEQGDLIALSGNSGGSGGPHLHFEVRSTATEKIINPLLFGFEVADHQHPDLYNLEVYEFDGQELVGSQTLDLLREGNGKYSLSGSSLVEVRHQPAFGITTFDRQDGYANRNGVYSIKLCIGKEVIYRFTMETFAFAETRYVNSHIDYAQKKCCRRTINKLYLDPLNNFSGYHNTPRMNLPELKPDSIYPVELMVTDAAGNESVLEFDLLLQPSPAGQNLDTPEPASIFKSGQPNFFKNDLLQFSLAGDALYSDVYFDYEKKEACDDCLSSVHRLGSEEIPVHQYYNLRIKPEANYQGDRSKLAIASIKKGKIIDYEGGYYEDGYVVGRTRQFGEFAVVLDTVAPRLKALNFGDGSSVAGKSRLNVYIEDEFSGIDEYRGTIDGKWVLFAYDAKNDLLYADLPGLNVEPGEHELTLTVSDKKNNSTTKSYRLIF